MERDTWCRDGHIGVVSKESNFSPLGDDFFSLSRYRPTYLRTTTSPSSKRRDAVRAQNCGSSIELKEYINVKITAHSHNALFSVQIS